jgi:hypothetical protein
LVNVSGFAFVKLTVSVPAIIENNSAKVNMNATAVFFITAPTIQPQFSLKGVLVKIS